MLLAVDVGNNNTKLGVYRGDELVADWRIRTIPDMTADEYGMELRGLFEYSGLQFRDVGGIAVSNVVPATMAALTEACRKFFDIEPFVINPEDELGITIRYEPRSDVGADRIADAIAVHTLYGGPAIVVDLGTATTFGAISADGEYLGGAIAPGIGTSTDALVQLAAKLRRVKLVSPPTTIGTTTETSMQAGIVFGFAGLVDAIVTRFRKELGEDAKVIATGGLANLVAAESSTIQIVNPLLTLEGLRIAYERSR